jgi:uncharacterized membrane protein YfcA
MAAGAAAGLFGVGGGIVIVPGLVMAAGYSQRLAHGTSLAAIAGIAASGVTGYGFAGEVDWGVALVMTAGGLVGAVLGTRLLRTLRQDQLTLAFAALLVVTAVRMLLGTPEGTGHGALDVEAVAGFAALGLASGFVAGLMGVGGGIVTVPALTLLAGFPLVLAKGTSLAVIVPTALVGTWRNHRHGDTDLVAAAVVAAGGVTSAYLASLVSLGLDPTVSAVLFAVLLVVTALRLARRERRS